MAARAAATEAAEAAARTGEKSTVRAAEAAAESATHRIPQTRTAVAARRGAAGGKRSVGKRASQAQPPVTTTTTTASTQLATQSATTTTPGSSASEVRVMVTAQTTQSTGVRHVDPTNRVLHEHQRMGYREQMARPYAEDLSLNKILGRYHRDGGTVGSGSTAAAVREERATGELVRGKNHLQKAEQGVAELNGWLEKNPTARPGDRAAAENMLRDLLTALRE